MNLHGFDLGLVEYSQALSLQEELLRKRCQGEGEDTLLLLEHSPVFTLGRGGDDKHLLNTSSLPVYRVGRGGDVTFHGPGQLVGYPIIDLSHHGRDVHAYLRGLEAVLIGTLAQFGIAAQRVEGLTGVWVEKQKIASIGIGVRRWITCHGFALNVDPDLTYFSHIIPCGLTGVEMTSMSEILDRPIEMAAIKPLVAEIFARYFGYKEIVWQENFLTQSLASIASQ